MWQSAYVTLNIKDTQRNNTLSSCWMSSCPVSQFIYDYAECHHAECRHTESRGAPSVTIFFSAAPENFPASKKRLWNDTSARRRCRHHRRRTLKNDRKARLVYYIKVKFLYGIKRASLFDFLCIFGALHSCLLWWCSKYMIIIDN